MQLAGFRERHSCEGEGERDCEKLLGLCRDYGARSLETVDAAVVEREDDCDVAEGVIERKAKKVSLETFSPESLYGGSLRSLELK